MREDLVSPTAFDYHRATRTVRDQGLARPDLLLDYTVDSAYATFHCADIERLLEVFGSRDYRAAPVEAGWTLERLHLAAYALGAGATRLIFFDVVVSSAFGTSTSPMTEVAVGVPAYRAKTGRLGAEAAQLEGRAMELYRERMRELQDGVTARGL